MRSEQLVEGKADFGALFWSDFLRNVLPNRMIICTIIFHQPTPLDYLLPHSSRLLSLQTRFDAGLIRSTTLKSVPFDSDIVATNLSELSPATKKHYKGSALKFVAKHAFSFVAIAGTVASISSPPAYAAKAAQETVEHLHVGQKIANFFRSFGIPDLAVLAIISAMPVVELRGAIPVS
jgi:hypothetical protein